MSLVAVIVAAMALVASPAAAIQKFYDSTFGTQSASSSGTPPSPSGTAFGGFFSSSNGGIGDVVINDSGLADGNGVDGWFYVVDRGNNRIQAFDQDRAFQWAIGRDVIAASVNEAQVVTVDASGGTYRLVYNATPTIPIAINASASTVDNALDPVVGADADVVVTGSSGGPYAVTFAAAQATIDQDPLGVDDTDLDGTVTVETLADGTAATPGNTGTGFEKCTVSGHCKAGQTGSLGGEFNIAQGMDANQDTGHFFVRERNSNARVQEFTADGEFVRAFGWDVVQEGTTDDTAQDEFETCFDPADCKAAVTSAAGGALNQPGLEIFPNPGQFGSITSGPAANANGLAVAPPEAPNAGEVFAADPGNSRVHRFTVPAEVSEPVEVGVPFGTTSTDGVPCSSLCGQPLGDGQYAAGNALTFPQELAVDANGVVYGSNSSTFSLIMRFDAGAVEGGFLTRMALQDIYPGTGGASGRFEIDHAEGHLLVFQSDDAGIREVDVSDKPDVVGDTHLVDTHVAGLSAAPRGIATDSGGSPGGRIAISTSDSVAGTGSGHRVLMLDADGADPRPDVTIDPVGNVGAAGASFSGNIDPVITSGFQTFYRWQVSKNGVDWTDVTSDALVGGDGFTPADVATVATGLDANTLYRVRIRTERRPSAGFAFSEELVFQTDQAPPAVETRAAQQVSDVGAQLVGRLNPGGLATDYWFEWGDTDFEHRVPAVPATAAGGFYRLVGERLTGLAPDTAYRFRLCARNVLDPAKICAADRMFMTLSALTASPTPGRQFEMVLNPDKPLRRGGERGRAGIDYTRLEAGLPAPGGGAFRAHLFAGALDADAGHGFNRDTTHEIRRRQPGGVWKGDAVFNLAPQPATSANVQSLMAESDDLTTAVWQQIPSMFAANGTLLGVRVLDDDGGPRGHGWYPWLDPAWFTGDMNTETGVNARIDAERIAAVGGANYRNTLTPLDDTVSPSGLTPPQTAGQSVFLSDRDHDWRPADLVNECTGAGATATMAPARDDNGTPAGPAGSTSFTFATYSATSDIVTVFTAGGQNTSTVEVGHYVLSDAGGGIPAGARVVEVIDAGTFRISVNTTGGSSFQGLTVGQKPENLADDTIGVRECGAGSPTDFRGAVLGGDASARLGRTASGAMSEDGQRVFFLSPDPEVSLGEAACDIGDSSVGATTACPAQLFVRQFDDAGNPTVRWLSRPEDALLDAGPHPDALGSGVSFEGASRDGRYVFFRTDAPLLESDPNGGSDPLVTASPHSWDLYRYDLGADANADPGAGDAGDRLTRISGGPGSVADPNTNCGAVPTSGPAECASSLNSQTGAAASPNGAGNALRFVSDGGDRAYFVTAARIPAAQNAAPAGSGAANLPTGEAERVNDEARNLYLYDAAADTWRFVARLPFALADGDLDSCATANGPKGGAPRRAVFNGFTPATARGRLIGEGTDCVRGSGSGDGIVFETSGQLTDDDTDDGFDVYAYDATAHRLTRLSAPPPGHDDAAYPCLSTDSRLPATASCNGDLGFGTPFDRQVNKEPGLFGARQWNVAQDSSGDLTEVYFQSRLPLVDGDVNVPDADGNGGMDVYRWRRGDGRLSLVSPGQTGDSAFFAGNSVDGRDVYFWTEQRISPWEIDAADGDVYNATTRPDVRPPPPPPPPVCAALAGGCHGGGSAPATADTKTTSPAGDENASPGARSTLALSPLSRKARRRAARTGRLSIVVRVSDAGLLRVQARARMGAKARRVARVAKRVKAGRTRVDLWLSAAARKSLRAGKRLRVRVVVRQSGARARAITVLLRRPAR